MAPSADAYWLGLRRVHGVGPRIARLLLDRFKTPERIFAESPETLAQTGIPRPTARNIAAFRDFDPLEKELCELPRLGARLVRWSDPDYPANLRHIADPPPYFFLRGSLPSDPRCMAVVGARTASEAGRRMAQRLGFELAGKGFTVVSGLARGIDSEAHQGALDAGGQHGCCDGLRHRRGLSAGESQAGRSDRGGRRRADQRVAGRHAADRRKFSRAQPADFRACASAWWLSKRPKKAAR